MPTQSHLEGRWVAGHVFISYSHRDSEYVKQLVAHLEKLGIPVWSDGGIDYGIRWVAEIKLQLETCAVLVPVMTTEAEKSTWVDREIDYAEELGKPILPLLLSGQKFFRLTNIQYEDVSAGQLPSEKFIVRLRRLVTMAPPPAETRAPAPAEQPVPAARSTGIEQPAVSPRPVTPTPPAWSRSGASGIQLQHTFPANDEEINAIAWSPDGRRFAIGNFGTVEVWSMATGEPERTLTGHTHWVRSAAFSPDGRHLATAAEDCTVRIWDLTTDQPARVLGNHGKLVYAAAYSPDGGRLVTVCDDRTTRVFDTVTGTLIHQRTRAFSWPYTVAYAPDGASYATAGADRVRIINATTFQQFRSLPGYTGLSTVVDSVAFAPDGQTIATGSSDKTARIWHVATGTTRQVLSGHTDRVYCVAFSPDGRRLATASGDLSARIWDVETGQQVRVLAGHTGRVRAVTWSPDGRFILTGGGGDNAVRLWQVPD